MSNYFVAAIGVLLYKLSALRNATLSKDSSGELRFFAQKGEQNADRRH